MKEWTKNSFMILVGCGLLAIAIKCIYDPARLVTGGFSGIAIIVKEWTSALRPGGISLGITTLVLNIPLFLISYFMMGAEFVRKSAAAVFLVSVWLLVLPEMAIINEDYVLASVFGGILAGIGIGLVLAAGCATGGTDMIATLINKKMQYYSIAQIMAFLDGMIILAGAFLFGVSTALYAIISVYLTARLSDGIVGGMHFAKSVFIISDEPDLIAEHVIKTMNRGITALHGVGMYTGKDRKVLFCVVSKKEIVQLKSEVYQIDNRAFVIVSDTKEVLGEGFLRVELKKAP